MGKKVLILSDFGTKAACALLEDNGCEIVRCSSLTPEAYQADVRDCDAVITSRVPTTTEIIDAAPRLKIISSFSVGVDMINVSYASEQGIWVANSGDANSNAVAEHAMYMILACAKHANADGRRCRAGDFFKHDYLSNIELAESTLGLIGCGNIGRRVAKMAHDGFGMNVLAYSRHLSQANDSDRFTAVVDMDELLAKSDFVSIHVPLNDSTRGMANASMFSKMKPSAFFINVSRGGLVVEKDLIEALKAGTIAGAGLDVFEREPVSADNELLKMENVVVSPHNAANCPSVWERMGLNAAKNILDVFRRRHRLCRIHGREAQAQPKKTADQPCTYPKADAYSDAPCRYR